MSSNEFALFPVYIPLFAEKALKRFEPAVHSGNDLSDVVAHLGTVAKQHAMFAGLRETKPA